jgi:endoglycosylceramidase
MRCPGRQPRHVLVALGVLAVAATACSSASSTHTEPPADAGRARDASRVPDARKDAKPDVRGDDAAHGDECTLAAPKPPDWRLVTDGPLLKDGLGRTVFLRGVDAGGRSKFAPYVPFDFPSGGFDAALEAYMARAESWGIDAMRVPFTWTALEPTRTSPPTYDSAWQAMYLALLASAWAHGIYTVVDFHQDVYSEVFCGDGFPAWTLPNGGADAGPPMHDCPQWQLEYFTDDAVKAAFDAFWPANSPAMTAYFAAWDEMMSQAADTPGVIGFEPINEPAAGSATLAAFEADTLTPFYSAIAAEMNAKAPKALVFFDGTELDGVQVSTNLGKPEGKNLVFAPHFYPIEQQPSSVMLGLGTWAGFAKTWDLPVLVGEFGSTNTNAATLPYMQSVFAGLDAYGLGGTEWEYSVSVDLWDSEMDSVVDPDGGEFPVAQALIRPFARAVAGGGITQSYDVGSRVFTLSYTATAGVTELRAPARAYPTGFTVQVTGGCYDRFTVPGEVLVQGSPGAMVTVELATTMAK